MRHEFRSNMADTILYLVRHGETDYNRNRIMQGRRIDSPLNALGVQQAEALASRLADIEFDAIYTSSLRRAIETADAVAVNHPDVPRYSLAGLDEMSWGVFEGEPRSQRLQAMLEEMYERWGSGDFDYRVDEGESINEVQHRSSEAISHIVEEHPGDTVLVVSHGRLLRVLLATILDVGLERMNEFKHANTCVNIITYAGSSFTSSLLNCTAHLSEADLELVE